MKDFIRRSTCITFRRFIGDVRREFMQRLSMVLHGTLVFYLRDASQEDGAIVVACLPAPRCSASLTTFFSSLLPDSTTFFVIDIF
jgi:hypothetical protein